MRITVDLPDALAKRIKAHAAVNSTTFQALLISALEKELAEEKGTFQLRDASVGNLKAPIVSSDNIRCHLERQRNFEFPL